MSAQVGIPQYKDLINREKLENIKKEISNLCMQYGKLASNENVNNRESDDYYVYSKQYTNDLNSLHALCLHTQKLYKELLDTMYIISVRSIDDHMQK